MMTTTMVSMNTIRITVMMSVNDGHSEVSVEEEIRDLRAVEVRKG